MILTIEAQFISLIMSVFAGLAIGILFDLYRTINLYTKPSKAFLYFMDLLFWIVTASVVFIILLGANFAQIRIYTFAGMAIGIFIYFKLFSEYILIFYRWFIKTIGKALRMLFILITLPFKLLRNLMWAPLNSIRKFCVKAFTGIKREASHIFKKNSSKKK